MPLSLLPSRAPQEGGEPDRDATRTSKRPRLYVLDGIRLLAALSVMLFHYVGKPVGWDQTWRGRPDRLLPGLHDAAIYGWVGVELFFLISGFVICMSCWGKRPQDFFVSRVVRLYPAYWTAVLITTGVVAAAGYSFTTAKDLTPRAVITNLTMLQAPIGAPSVDPSYWTLWVEMLFYVLFAVVVVVGLTYRRVVAFCGIWMFLAVLAPAVDLPLLSTLAQADYAPFFTAGITMFLMYRFGPNLLLWCMLGFCWMVAQYRLQSTVEMYQQWLPQHISWTVATALMTLCFLQVLGAALGLFDRIQWRRLTVAGALTYPVYLLHQELGVTGIHWLRQWLAPRTTLALVVLGVLLLSYLVHRLVETPVSGLLKRGLGAAFASVTEADERARAAAAGEVTRA
ncbi:acyltransferase family protein [Kitasatospora viridis]|uniref:Peptidoglycan/LPS O-acetylase OafA/YrhL n=1 Tax=Kitasatospora viridis TaxID=281105 RepID=A0A561UJM4_9ACTN|nr:acyltransferase [Kitasatospora viridis]TWF99546.1 peptidoglycan/LPS O-acetylase OafA/YrhL [Kitasatospora viridis]